MSAATAAAHVKQGVKLTFGALFPFRLAVLSEGPGRASIKPFESTGKTRGLLEPKALGNHLHRTIGFFKIATCKADTDLIDNRQVGEPALLQFAPQGARTDRQAFRALLQAEPGGDRADDLSPNLGDQSILMIVALMDALLALRQVSAACISRGRGQTGMQERGVESHLRTHGVKGDGTTEISPVDLGMRWRWIGATDLSQR